MNNPTWRFQLPSSLELECEDGASPAPLPLQVNNKRIPGNNCGTSTNPDLRSRYGARSLNQLGKKEMPGQTPWIRPTTFCCRTPRWVSRKLDANKGISYPPDLPPGSEGKPPDQNDVVASPRYPRCSGRRRSADRRRWGVF
ncbi:unnamed protein product [Linum trigynum]|uniref:Uncharacterized protein n=1 Tax=Linum trigynum TaxID=586398 RepID=A0AAV2GAN7_9ROSI